MKFIIIGPENSGKKTLMKSLSRNGVPINKFYTTNPNADPEIYDVITNKDDFDSKILVSESDGYEYFTTHEKLIDCRAIHTDIDGLKELCESNPRESFKIMIITTSDDEIMLKRIAWPENSDFSPKFKHTQPSPEYLAEYDEYTKRFAEWSKYSKFLKFTEQNDLFESPYGFQNITTVTVATNDATEKSIIFNFHMKIKNDLRTHNRMQRIICDLIHGGFVDTTTDEAGNIYIKCSLKNDNSGDVISKEASVDVFTEYVLIDPKSMKNVIDTWLFYCDALSALI